MTSIQKYIILVLAFTFFSCGKPIANSCNILDKVNFLKVSGFSPDVKFGIVDEESILLNQKQYKELFGEEKIESDSCTLFGKFRISNDRIGVYMHRSTNECDHRINLIELILFDNCKKIDSKTLMFEDNNVFIFRVSSKFNRDFNRLTITEESSSEYAIEPGITTDTLFTKTYEIDLKSKNLDTIHKTTKFKILNPPPQK